MKTTEVNFTVILRATFAHQDPKSAKINNQVPCPFGIFAKKTQFFISRLEKRWNPVRGVSHHSFLSSTKLHFLIYSNYYFVSHFFQVEQLRPNTHTFQSFSLSSQLIYFYFLYYLTFFNSFFFFICFLAYQPLASFTTFNQIQKMSNISRKT